MPTTFCIATVLPIWRVFEEPSAATGLVMPIPTLPEVAARIVCPPAYKLVVVAFVEVLLVEIILVAVKRPRVLSQRKEAESAKSPPIEANGTLPLVSEEMVAEPRAALVEKRFVEEAVVEKKFVVVAEVPVARVKTRSVRVCDALVRLVKFPFVEKKFVVVALVVVELPKMAKPTLAFVEKRLVEEAVVEKREVVVAFVPVAFTKVKFCSVDEPVTRRLPSEPVPVEEMSPEPALIVLLFVRIPFVQVPAISRPVVPVPVLLI